MYEERKLGKIDIGERWRKKNNGGTWKSF